VTSYPWIACFYQGKKVDDMAGLSGAESVVNWANAMVEKFEPVGEEPVLRSQNHPPLGPKARGGDGAGGDGADGEHGGALEEPEPVGDDGKPLLYAGEGSKVGYGKKPWREQLGNHAWFYLHSLAANYPDAPSAEDKSAVRMLMASFGQLFPCKLCRRHLQGNLADAELGPVAADSRAELSVWMCKLHNTVNKQNGKSELACELDKLDRMYRNAKAADAGGSAPAPVWDAAAVARDGGAALLASAAADEGDGHSVEELLAMALEYNVLTPKKADKMRDQIGAKPKEESKIKAKVVEMLRPIFKLKAEIARLEKVPKAPVVPV